MSEQIDRMQHLYNQAMETGPARAAIDRLVYCHLLVRLTSGDQQLASTMFGDEGTAEAAIQELEDLDDKGQAELAAVVCPTFNTALSLAVHYMWRACQQLGYDPATLDPKHTALLASVFLGPDFTHLAQRLAADS